MTTNAERPSVTPPRDDAAMTEPDDWPPLPDPIPANPYDEDGYCDWCGNGKWKYHAPWCKWQDAKDGVVWETQQPIRKDESS